MATTPAKLGRYRLEEKLAEGGMAAVYRAYDEDLHRTVAVKVMREVISQDPVFAKRFVREARTIASFDHPNILTVFDFGASGDTVYIVLPLVEGGSLKERLGRPIRLPVVVDWLRQVAAALDYAHVRGVLHRDIKPANIMVNREGRLLLSDFGIARSTEAGAGLTTTGELLGTPNYMSPEQAIGKLLDGRADQYSLAVMAYEMLTGSVPFKADTPLLVLNKHVREVPEPPSRRASGLPAAVDGVFARALAKDPAERFATCSEFSEGFARAAAEATLATIPEAETSLLAETHGIPAAEPTARTAPREGDSRPQRIGRPLAAAAALILLVVAALLGGRIVARRVKAPDSSRAEASPAVEVRKPAAPARGDASATDAGSVPESSASPASRTVEFGAVSNAPVPPRDDASGEPRSDVRRGRASASAASAREGAARSLMGSEPAAVPRSGRAMARPLIRSGAAAALSAEIGEAYRALSGHPSREDFARARGLAAGVAASHSGDPEALFLRDYAAAAVDFADGNDRNAELLLRRGLSVAPRSTINPDAVFFVREAMSAGNVVGRPEAAWELGLAFADVRGDLASQLDRALERDPDSARVKAARAVFFRDRGETEKARQEARAACKAAGDSYPIACRLARELR